MDHLQQQQHHHQQEKQPQDTNDSLSTDTSNVSKPNIETLLQGNKRGLGSVDQMTYLDIRPHASCLLHRS